MALSNVKGNSSVALNPTQAKYRVGFNCRQQNMLTNQSPNSGTCPHCGAPNEYSLSFCNLCGNRLPWADALKSNAKPVVVPNQPVNDFKKPFPILPVGLIGGGIGVCILLAIALPLLRQPKISPTTVTAPPTPQPVVVVAPTPMLQQQQVVPTPVATPNEDDLYRENFFKSVQQLEDAAKNWERSKNLDIQTNEEAMQAMRNSRKASADAKYACKNALDGLGSVSVPKKFLRADSLMRQSISQFQSAMEIANSYFDRYLTTGMADQSSLTIAGRQVDESNSLLSQALAEFKRANL